MLFLFIVFVAMLLILTGRFDFGLFWSVLKTGLIVTFCLFAVGCFVLLLGYFGILSLLHMVTT